MLPAMAVTLQDIAEDLQVSVVTVSKVLRNKGKISVGTRKRVLDRARQLNYKPNWIARSLATRRTYTIGLLLPDFTHPFFAEIAKTVAETVRAHGYHVVISYSEEDANLERSEVEALLARQVDGLIIASAQSKEQAGFFENIRQRKTPFVLVDRPVAGVHAGFVGVDDEEIGRLATEHLIAQGCKTIAHLRGPQIGLAESRFAGYRETLKKNGMSMRAEHVVEAGFEDQTGHAAMKELLANTERPDGVFCYNDPIAIGAMKAIKEARLKVPEDIAVVGAGNVHYSDVLAVPLSTIDQETARMGIAAAEMLIEQIETRRTLQTRKILLSPRLVVRESSRRLAHSFCSPRIDAQSR